MTALNISEVRTLQGASDPSEKAMNIAEEMGFKDGITSAAAPTLDTTFNPGLG